MIEFTFWDIVRNLLLAARWTVLLSLAAFVGGALVAQSASIHSTCWAKSNQTRRHDSDMRATTGLRHTVASTSRSTRLTGPDSPPKACPTRYR